MTARARHDRGERWIDPDADACGVRASIQAVQHSAPARPSSPRPAQQPAPGLIRGAWACADNRETDPNQLPFAADKVHQARHLRIAASYDGPHREQTATTQCSHAPAQNDPLWAAEKAGSRGARTAQIGGFVRVSACSER